MKIPFKSKLPIALWRPPHNKTLTAYSSTSIIEDLSSNLDTKLNRASLTSRTNMNLPSIAEEDSEIASTPILRTRKNDNNFKSSSSTCFHKSSLPNPLKSKFSRSRSTSNLTPTQIKSERDTVRKPSKPPIIKTPFIFPYPIKKKPVVGGNSPAFKKPYHLSSTSLGSLTKSTTKKTSLQKTKPQTDKNVPIKIPTICKKNNKIEKQNIGESTINHASVVGQRYIASKRAASVVYQRHEEPEENESFDQTALLLECDPILNNENITIELAELYAQLQVNLKEYSIIIQQLQDCYIKDIETKTLFLEISPRPDKKLLVLDLDHTLCDMRDEPSLVQESTARPFLLEFLKAIYQYYEIAIWSETNKPLIQAKLNILGLNNIPNFKILLTLDYDDMITVAIPHVGLRKIKPLSIIWNNLEQFSKINTIILDDLPFNFYLNSTNGLQVKPYYKEDFITDAELQKIAVYLNAIAKFCTDFSSLSHRHYGKYRNI